MEGPTPVSALIHAATMVAAGVFLVARLRPLFEAAPGALETAAVIACVTMLGAALAAFAQDDIKRLLAWSTISQVAFMLAGVTISGGSADGAGPGVYHLLSHAGFKALLFLVAGCVTHLAGSTRLADLGGLLADRPWLAGALGLGLASLAGLPPLSGFWSKEAVLSAAEHAASSHAWTGWLVLLVGLLTTLVTGLYCGRAWALVAQGPSREDAPEQTALLGDHSIGDHATGDRHTRPALPRSMLWPLAVLAVPTVLLGLLAITPRGALAGVAISGPTAVTGALLALAGVGWSLTAPRLAGRDVADALSPSVRRFLQSGYRLDAVQQALVVRPVLVLARVVAAGDRDVVDGYVRGSALLARTAGRPLLRLSSGLATGYLLWLVAGAVAVGLLGVALA
jgi:NADH-quinone oxidoreductase subunit L